MSVVRDVFVWVCTVPTKCNRGFIKVNGTGGHLAHWLNSSKGQNSFG